MIILRCYQYEELPNKLKVQLIHIWKETIGEDYSGGKWNPSSENRNYLETCYNILCKELGVFELNKDDTFLGNTVSYSQNISKYLLTEKNIEKALSVVELMVGFTKIFADTISASINISDTIRRDEPTFPRKWRRLSIRRMIKLLELILNSFMLKQLSQLYSY